jgi:hypothetical protein
MRRALDAVIGPGRRQGRIRGRQPGQSNRHTLTPLLPASEAAPMEEATARAVG